MMARSEALTNVVLAHLNAEVPAQSERPSSPATTRRGGVMAAPSSESNTITGINVTPLVDITLVLLIIFMVTAKLVVAPNSALKLTLPRSSTGEQVSPVFAVTMRRDGTTRVNGQPVTDDPAFIARASAERQAHPDLRAVIEADGEVTHARVVHVMDLLGRAGVAQIAFAVTLEPGAARAP